MATYGITSTGFVPKTLEIVRDEVNADLRARFGPSIPLGDDEILGQIVGILAEREALLWELLETVYNMMDPDAATGTLQDAICALTGTVRLAATRSLVALVLTGTNGTVIPISSQVSTLSTDIFFRTLAQATLATLISWAPTTAYTLGQQRTNAGRCYQVITAGTSAGSGGPTTTAADITDGTVHWRYLGEGAAATNANAEAVNTGPQVALTGDITVIETPVGGWQSVINMADATPGRNVESDADLRVRREEELAAPGKSPIDAIRSDLLDVSGVTAVRVFENVTDVTDADGVPPHSVEALVQGGTDQAIFDQLLDSVAGGIRTHGTTSGTSTDEEGVVHTMKFSRPTTINIWVIITLVKDAATYPADGDTQVKTAITTGSYVGITGKDAVSSAIAARAFQVKGVLDVTACLIGTADPPVASTTIAIALRQLAAYDSARITVNTSNGTP